MDQHAHYLTSIDRIYNGPAPTPRPEPIRVSGSLRWQHALALARTPTPTPSPPDHPKCRCTVTPVPAGKVKEPSVEYCKGKASQFIFQMAKLATSEKHFWKMYAHQCAWIEATA